MAMSNKHWKVEGCETGNCQKSYFSDALESEDFLGCFLFDEHDFTKSTSA